MKKFISILFILNIFIAVIFADVRGIGVMNRNEINNTVYSLTINKIPGYIRCFSPDDKYIATTNGNKIMLWDVSSGRLLREFVGYNDSVFSVDFSFDGKYIAGASNDKTVKVWEISTGKIIKVIDRFCYVKYTKDGLMTYIWKKKTKEFEILIYNEKYQPILEAKPAVKSDRYFISNDGIFIASRCGTEISDINIINLKNKFNIKLKDTSASYDDKFSFSSNGKYFAAAFSDHNSDTEMEKTKVVIWNIKTGDIEKILYQKGLVTNIAFSLDDKKLLAFELFNKKLYLYDVDSWNLKNEFIWNHWNDIDINFVFSHNGKYIAVNDFGVKKLSIFDSSTFENISEIGISNESIWSYAYSPDGKYIVTIDESFNLNIRDSVSFEIFKVLNLKNFLKLRNNRSDIMRLDFSSDGNFLFCTGLKVIMKYNLKTGKIQNLLENSALFSSVDYSKDGNYIVSSDMESNSIKIWSTESGKLIRKINAAYPINTFFNCYNDIYTCFSICENRIYTFLETLSKENPSIKIWDFNTGKLIKELNNISSFGMFCFKSFEKFISKESDNSKFLLYNCIGNKNYLEVFDINKLNAILRIELDNDIEKTGCISSFSLDEKYIVFVTQNAVKIYNLKNKNLLHEIPVNFTEYKEIHFIPNTNMFSVNSDDKLVTFDLISGEIVSTILNAPNGEYITYTPEGFFTGTEWATKNLVYLVDGLDIIELDQMYDKLYRPDLVAAKLQGQDISAYAKGISLSDIAASGAAPAVNILNKNSTSQSRDIMLDFSVTDKGGGIGSVNYSVNGKVYRYSDGLKSSKGQTFTCSIPVTLDSGNNLIQVFAMNGANEISSKKALLNLTWNGNVNRPNLFVMTVAVNNYRDSGLKLNYCVNDADSLEKALLVQNGSLYNRVVVESLRDKDVTKQNLVKKFNDLSNKVSPDDVFVFFISGHGTTYNDGDYYFIPYDYLGTRADSLVTDAVSKNDLLKNLSLVKAKKSLVLLDTCSSGAFASDKGQRGMTEKTAIDRLANATGQAVIAACSDNQFAMEGYNGHGLFTYVLLDAMKGGADRNNDGFISMQELSSYIGGEVISRSEEKWGYAQVPYSSLTASEFPLFSVSGNSASLPTSYSNGNSNIIKLNGLNASAKDKITTISGKGLNYSFDGRNWSISASRIQNEDKTVSGDLRLSIWLSDHIWERRKYSGHRMASIIYEHLEPQYGYSNISREIESTNENPESGMYYVVFCIEEYSSDGKWYVSAYLTFDNKIKWTQKQNYTIYN